MSDAHNEHESAIRTPKQLIAAIVASFVIPIIAIVLLVKYVASEQQTGVGADNSPEIIAARIQPVADRGFTLKDASAPRVFMAGAEVYKMACAACHTTGAAGAPKLGDAGAWTARIGQGAETLISHAINGIRGMPAKGGNADLADFEVASAVVYMANQSGGKLKEPTPPAPAAPAAAEAPAAAAPAAK